MRTLHIPVVLATTVVALTCASSSFAQTKPSTQPQQPQQQTQPVQTQPAQPQQMQTQPAQPQQMQTQPVQPQPVQPQPQYGTAQTTAAPYAPPQPGGERVIENRPNSTLLSTGAGLFLLSYGPSAVAGALSPRDEDKRLFIPVAGPWMDLANRSCGREHPCGTNEDVAKAMVITSGVVQGAGVLMAVSSLIIPETTTVSEQRASAKPPKPQVAVVPMSVNAGAGIAAVGRF